MHTRRGREPYRVVAVPVQFVDASPILVRNHAIGTHFVSSFEPLLSYAVDGDSNISRRGVGMYSQLYGDVRRRDMVQRIG